MIVVFNLIALLGVLSALAAITAIGNWLVERAHPPKGRIIEVDGGRLHVDDLGDRGGDVALVLVHGASGNMEDMRLALADALSARWRVILIDRPGRGWSARGAAPDASSPQRQADIVAQALAKIGVKRAIVVGHSWGGALATAFAIRHPAMTAGLVLLAPTSHPWKGGVSWYYTLATAPVLGPVFVHTLLSPIGALLVEGAAASVFHPQTPPENYVKRSATWLVLRPSAFMANARDVTDLKDNLDRLVPLYPKIAAPTVILTGDRDTAVSNDIHSAALVQAIPDARLEMLPGVGHMPHHARLDRVVAAIEEIMQKNRSPASAAN